MSQIKIHDDELDPVEQRHNLEVLESKKLLVVSHQYNKFVKSQVDELSNYFESIIVLVRYNRLMDFIAGVGVNSLKTYTSSMKINHDRQPDNVEVIGTPLTYIPHSIGRFKLGSRHANKVKKVVRQHDIEFDIVHSHLSWTAGYAGHQISQIHDVPHIITVHENRDWMMEEIQSTNDKIHESWRNAEFLIRVNRTDKNELKEFNDNVVYISNGFETQRFTAIPQQEARTKLGLNDGKTIIFSLSTLTKRKGFQNVIEILPDLVKEEQNIKYVIGGKGPFESELKSVARSKGVDEFVDFRGFIPNSELKYWMSGADLFVHPSYSESYGLVQLEALASGTPVVAAENGGSEEVIVSEELGLLIDDPENHQALFNSIQKGLERDWDSNTLVDYAEQFTIPEVCKSIASLMSSTFNEFD